MSTHEVNHANGGLDFLANQERALIFGGLLLVALTGLYIGSQPFLNPLEFPRMAQSVGTQLEGAKSLNFALSKVTPFLKNDIETRVLTQPQVAKPVAKAAEKVIRDPHLPEGLIPPALGTPPLGAKVLQGQNLLLTWESSPMFKTYEIQIARDAGFSRPDYEQNVPKNLFAAFDTTQAGEYYWRVRGVAESEKSAWGAVGRFKVEARPGAARALAARIEPKDEQAEADAAEPAKAEAVKPEPAKVEPEAEDSSPNVSYIY